MTLQTQSFTTLVTGMAAAAQGAASSLLNVTVGSVTRALLESVAGVSLWLQYLILQVLQITRLATSTGADVDSWVADFGVTRLPGVASTVQITASSLSPSTQSAVIPVGAAFARTSGATLTFQVYADPTNPAYSAAAGGYIRPAGTASIIVPCICQTAGVVGNVQAGTINLAAGAFSGIDTVSNANAATGGLDAETDAALKNRFTLYINSRSGGTLQAIQAAVAGVQQGLIYAVLSNAAPDGSYRGGFFTVLVDDGSGSPSASLIEAVSAAVAVVRPIGISFAVVGPQVVRPTVTAAITVATGAANLAAQNAASQAVANYLSSLPIGATASYPQISAVMLLSSSSITGVTSLTVNGGQNNVTASAVQAVRPGTITITATGGN